MRGFLFKCMSVYQRVQPSVKNRTYHDGKNNLSSISWEIWNYADGQCCCEGHLQLEGKPSGSEKVGNNGCESHACNNQETFVSKTLDEYSGDDGHKDEPHQISPCRSGDFAKPPCKTGEDRQTGDANQ